MDATIYLSTPLLIGTAGEAERNDLVMENTNALSNISVLKGVGVWRLLQQYCFSVLH